MTNETVRTRRCTSAEAISLNEELEQIKKSNERFYRISQEAQDEIRDIFDRLESEHEKELEANVVGAILGTILGVAFEIVMIKKWRFDKHPKILNLLMTGSTTTNQYKIYCAVVNVVNAITVIKQIDNLVRYKRNHR